MSLVETYVPWSSQPPMDNPAMPGVHAVLHPLPGQVDLVTRLRMVYTSANPQSRYLVGRAGFGRFVSSSNPRSLYPVRPFTAGSPLMLLSVFHTSNPTSQNDNARIGNAPSSFRLLEITTNTSGQVLANARGSDAVVRTVTGPTITGGQVVAAVATYEPGVGVSLVVDGEDYGTAGFTQNLSHVPTVISDSISTNGIAYLSAWLDADVWRGRQVELTENPWAIFQPRRVWAPVSASSGPTPTEIACGAGLATAQGYSAQLALRTAISAGVGLAGAQGYPAAVTARTVVSAGVGLTGAQGYAASVATRTVVSAGVGLAGAYGLAAQVATRTTVAAGIGLAAAAGYQATVQIGSGTTINCGVGVAGAQGYAAALATRTVISAGVGLAGAYGLAAQVATRTTIAAGIGLATAAGYQATVQLGSGTTINCGPGLATAGGHAAGIALRTHVQAGLGLASAAGHAATITVPGGMAALSPSRRRRVVYPALRREVVYPALRRSVEAYPEV